ncbi:MAG: iron-containing redox enzyme family protein [Patescibacteria group bacterium]
MLTLNKLIEHKISNYELKIKNIRLFHKDSTLSLAQAKKFVLAFYHARGHFYKFLWILGCFALNNNYKEVVVNNLEEEFGGRASSHEQLYLDFSKNFGVDILSEILSESNYPDFLKEFNRGHISWLLKHNWTEKWSAFAAYESLDNSDYRNLLKLLENLNPKVKDLRFFKVHSNANHFESTSKYLSELWELDAQSVENGFDFILPHQLNMWSELSNYVYSG